MIDLLSRRAAKWPPDWREEYEERFAIMQHLGNLTKDQAQLNAFYWVGARMDKAAGK